MKNIKLYIIIGSTLVIGVFLGKVFFNNTTTHEMEHSHTDLPSDKLKQKTWTCSMHPQIRSHEPGECPICGMELIPANSTHKEQEHSGFQMTERAIKLANIQTSVIGDNDNDNNVSLNVIGKLQANETKIASLVSHIPGRIERLFVNFTGEYVRKGQKIATLYSPDLITAQNELLESYKISDVSPGLLEASKNKLRYWKINDKTINEILSSGIVKEKFDIHADFSGIVSQRKVSVGDHLKMGEVLLNIQNLENLWALFDVYEIDIAKIRIGNKIKFTTPALPNNVYEGVVTFIDPIINSNTRVAKIRAEVQNKDRKLKPEMFIYGQIFNDSKSDNLIVPKTAVLWTGIKSVVYVKKEHNNIPTFEFREIEIGESSKNGYKIIKGLEIGEEVVTNGAFVIDASAQLNNQNSMMNRNVTIKYNKTQDTD